MLLPISYHGRDMKIVERNYFIMTANDKQNILQFSVQLQPTYSYLKIFEELKKQLYIYFLAFSQLYNFRNNEHKVRKKINFLR
jgi:hypothetical protein